MPGIIDRIFATFAQHGAESYGEDVTQLQHALQAAELARLDGAPDPLIAAALLHDIGQFIGDAGNAAELQDRDGRHEELGAALLADSFTPEVTEPIRLHVAAKRYLATARPGYINQLTDASRVSFALQGGHMSASELTAFERDPHFDAAVRMRLYDDGGKHADWEVPSLQSYRPLLVRLSA
jgi:phosphonate degradation associated HDIG domain protein